MKKISAVFDGLRYSKSTQMYALELAAKSKGMISGIFLDDFTYHSYKLFDMVGSQGVSKVKLTRLMNKDKETRLASAAKFEKACMDAGVRYAIHHDKSIAEQELLRESIYSDLILISVNETFTHYKEDAPTDFIRNLLIDIQCPAIILPNEYRKIEKVILLYDGKPASVFAIKMFNYLLPWMENVDTEVVSVTDPENSVELVDSELIKEFVNYHYPEATYSTFQGKPQVEIVAFLKQLAQTALIVLGAYNRGAVSRWFKVSMADVLMKEISMPLFIAH